MWRQPAASNTRTYFLYDSGPIPIAEFDQTGKVIAYNTVGVNGLLSRAVGASPVVYTGGTPPPLDPGLDPPASPDTTVAAGASLRIGGGTAAATGISGWTQTFYAFNWRGDTVNRLNSSSNLLSTSTYAAYGAQSTAQSNTDPFDGFGGQWGYHKETEGPLLYLAGQRYYSPDQGRWLSRDPIGYAGGINLYSYAGNNPVNGVDPWGLDISHHRLGIDEPFAPAYLRANGWHSTTTQALAAVVSRSDLAVGRNEKGGVIVRMPNSADPAFRAIVVPDPRGEQPAELSADFLTAIKNRRYPGKLVAWWHTHPLLQGLKYPDGAYGYTNCSESDMSSSDVVNLPGITVFPYGDTMTYGAGVTLHDTPNIFDGTSPIYGH